MSYVYIVFYCMAHEGNKIVGLFDNYVDARDFELKFLCKHQKALVSNWTEIRKVNLNETYDNTYEDCYA